MKHNSQHAFTLIELLVVISIIGLLATIVLSSVNIVRAKARDARRIADIVQLSKASALFYELNNRMPTNYAGGQGECDTWNTNQYNQTMQEIINAGLISRIPTAPSPTFYCYYDYGPGNSIGALWVTLLEAAPPSTTGLFPSCRPWGPAQNWCDQ